MKFKGISVYVITGLIILISSCSEEIIKVNNEADYNYFPLEVGSYVDYRLDSFIYNDFTMMNYQETFLVRELVESIFIDAAGKEVYRLERAYKREVSDAWGSAGYDIWFSNIEGENAEKIEENQRYIKLAFPLDEGKEWKGNIHINTDPVNDNDIDSTVESPLAFLADWDYTIEQLGEPYSTGSLNFEETVTVIQREFGIQTDTVGAHEIYAKGIGLIHKELWVLSTQCSSCDDNDIPCKIECFNSGWLDKGEAGFVMKQEIIGYGQL